MPVSFKLPIFSAQWSIGLTAKNGTLMTTWNITIWRLKKPLNEKRKCVKSGIVTGIKEKISNKFCKVVYAVSCIAGPLV